MVGKYFQPGSMRVWRPSRPIWQYLVVWLLKSLFFIYQAGQLKVTLVEKPAEQWAVDLRAGCPPNLADRKSVV